MQMAHKNHELYKIIKLRSVRESVLMKWLFSIYNDTSGDGCSVRSALNIF